MDRIKAVTEYLFSDLEEEKGYPYENCIRKALRILKGEPVSSENSINSSPVNRTQIFS